MRLCISADDNRFESDANHYLRVATVSQWDWYVQRYEQVERYAEYVSVHPRYDKPGATACARSATERHTSMLARSFATLAFLVACHSSSPVATSPTPAPGSAEPTAGSAQPTASTPAPAISEKCGANDVCVEGATCVSYYGIAGPQGPQFKSCEIKCDGDAKCPSGRKCVTVADGPGRVCR